jgi:predicted O-methyltransferase YrrM
MFPDNPQWHLHTGVDIAEVIGERIGDEIDILLLDTTHLHPAETLSFLSIFPYLTDEAIVVLHDVNLAFYWINWSEHLEEIPAYATTLLLNSVVADKLTLNFFYDGYKHPNIAAFQINEDTRKYMSDVFRSLFMPWGMLVDERILAATGHIVREKYSPELFELYERSVRQAKRHQENRERLENRKKPDSTRHFTGPVYDARTDKVKKAIGKILKSNDQQFHNRHFIMEMLKEHGIYFNGWEWPNPFLQWQNPDCDFGLLQIPSEFVDFAMYICGLGINTMAEIGAFCGASSYFLAAMLTRASGGNIEYSMVDINDEFLAFDSFAEILNIKKLAPSTSDALYGHEFDFVFVDADHSYKGVLRDYLNVGQYCRKGVAFHDIHGHGHEYEYDHQDGGIVRFWNEFKSSHLLDMTILEFSHSIKPWMGIGVGIKHPQE